MKLDDLLGMELMARPPERGRPDKARRGPWPPSLSGYSLESMVPPTPGMSQLPCGLYQRQNTAHAAIAPSITPAMTNPCRVPRSIARSALSGASKQVVPLATSSHPKTVSASPGRAHELCPAMMPPPTVRLKVPLMTGPDRPRQRDAGSDRAPEN